jgi:hypothetical protein
MENLMGDKSRVDKIGEFQHKFFSPLRVLIDHVEKISLVLALFAGLFVFRRGSAGDLGPKDIAILFLFVPFIGSFCYMIADSNDNRRDK